MSRSTTCLTEQPQLVTELEEDFARVHLLFACCAHGGGKNGAPRYHFAVNYPESDVFTFCRWRSKSEERMNTTDTQLKGVLGCTPSLFSDGRGDVRLSRPLENILVGLPQTVFLSWDIGRCALTCSSDRR